MRNLHYLFLLFLLPTLSIGQGKFDYTVSEPFRVIDARYKTYASKKGQTLAIKKDGKDIYMQHFDAVKMKEIQRKKISDLPKGYVIENISWFKDKLYCYYSLWDKKNTTEQLFVREIDFENCQFKAKEKRIVAVKGKLTGAPMFSMGFGGFSFRVESTPKFDFLYSKDKSKLLVQYRRKPEKKRDAINHDIIGMFVFNNDLEKLSGSDIEMPYTEKKMDNIDYSVDAEGNAYILAKVRPDGSDKNTKKDKKDKAPNYHIELFKVAPKTKKIKITKIQLKDKFINGIWLFESDKKEMLCAGYYNKNNYATADGIFVFKLDKEGGINDKIFHEIPVEILNQYTTSRTQKKNEKKEKKGKAEFSSLVMDKLVIQKDGSIILMGEQYYVVVTYDSKGRARYTYHYNDILVSKISPDGKLAWMRKLPKRQTGGRGQGSLSYKHMSMGGNHYFVFLDNIKNLDLGLDERPARHMDGLGGFFTAYKVPDGNGKVSKVSIFDTKDVKDGLKIYQFSVDRILEVSSDEFIMEAYKKGKEDVMIKVKVK
ncbi:hypothetical protein [Aureispira anguillae]|uniref:Uncharacterized protein n=1 Tax=Aureispira anguillae TaxID=2864201 RepID=A0A915YLS1_9BACT|nr:hypothetical protein [Aureispira anguillae]BDS15572.1 hypothetical protein AsAng_0063560 [Aureispira anguillae]